MRMVAQTYNLQLTPQGIAKEKGAPSAESSHALRGPGKGISGLLFLCLYARRLIQTQDLQDTSRETLLLRQS
jgi:hypothetical protein